MGKLLRALDIRPGLDSPMRRLFPGNWFALNQLAQLCRTGRRVVSPVLNVHQNFPIKGLTRFPNSIYSEAGLRLPVFVSWIAHVCIRFGTLRGLLGLRSRLEKRSN